MLALADIILRIQETYLPLRVVSILNGLEQILTDEIRVLARHLLSFLPDHTGFTLQRLPVELDQLSGALVVDEAEGMDTEAVDVSERTRYTVASHCPEQRVQRTGLLAEKVPGGIVGCCGLGDFIVATGLDSMNQVGEEDSILDEKDWNVIADEIWRN